MEISELQDFVDWEMGRLEVLHGKGNEELKPWDAVKLSEEVGELQSEVLGHSGLCRKEKLDMFSTESFEKEFADVIISACILARRHKINIVDALTRKIEIIRGRKY